MVMKYSEEDLEILEAIDAQQKVRFSGASLSRVNEDFGEINVVLEGTDYNDKQWLHNICKRYGFKIITSYYFKRTKPSSERSSTDQYPEELVCFEAHYRKED